MKKKQKKEHQATESVGARVATPMPLIQLWYGVGDPTRGSPYKWIQAHHRRRKARSQELYGAGQD